MTAGGAARWRVPTVPLRAREESRMSIGFVREESVTEFTVRAVVAGILFRGVFGAPTASLGRRVGLTVSTPFPIGVLAVALLKLLRTRPGVLLEANISQTIGPASSSLGGGTIFTTPAFSLGGRAPPYWQVAILALLG